MSPKSTNHSSSIHPIAANQKESVPSGRIGNCLPSEFACNRSFRLTFLVFSCSIGAICTTILNSFPGNLAYASELPIVPVLEPAELPSSTSPPTATISSKSDGADTSKDLAVATSDFWTEMGSANLSVSVEEEIALSTSIAVPVSEDDLNSLTLTFSSIETVEFSELPLTTTVPLIEAAREEVAVSNIRQDLALHSPEPIAQPSVAQQSAADLEELSVAQQRTEGSEDGSIVSHEASDLIGTPLIDLQGAYILQGDESSARLRATGIYVFNPSMMVGATVDLTTGNAFSDSDAEGLNLNELYFTASPEDLPGLRFTIGLLDLTSYFDRNSFAKDSLTHFFNSVFQTNPALAATGIGSRPALLVNWMVTDHLELKAATFSSSRDLSEFALDGFAGEIGVRLGNLILRGTYATDRDAGQDDGFREIFQFSRNGGETFGLLDDDRETAYGLNAELFIPELNLGLFGRYGHYENQDLESGGDTYSIGLNLLDLFFQDDRLGLAYGRQLSNDELREDEGDKIPDVLELFYDVRLTPNLRAGVTIQQRDGFSETVMGFRVRADMTIAELGRLFR